MVDFAGWHMPLNYGSQIEEHHAVRNHAGRFDVSHMAVVDVGGRQAREFLRFILVNDVDRLDVGQALYSVMVDDAGGIIDDLIAYRRTTSYRIVVNAATRTKDLGWLGKHAASFDVEIAEREDHGIIAVQGPRAIEAVDGVFGITAAELAPFTFLEHDGCLIARTGYTGEDGVEIVCPANRCIDIWSGLGDAGVVSAGLGARDTLRLEAGLNLYGQDMDEKTSPLVSNVAWTVAWEPENREFLGRIALEAERRARPDSKLTGIVLDAKGVIRHGYGVATSTGEGVVTSGIFSPTLGVSIALARLPRRATGECTVDIRGRAVPARIVKPPFVRFGEKVYV